MSFGLERFKNFICLSVLILANLTAKADLSLGPLYNRSALTLSEGWREEWLGPFFYRELSDTTYTIGIPPLLSYYHDSDIDRRGFDFLYPLLGYREYGSEYRFNIFQIFSLSGGSSGEDGRAKRTTIFPIYFKQHSTNPEENYTAIVPFYGTLKNRLFYEEVHFVMFPFYSQTKKKGAVTDNYLVPFFHVRRGLGLKGWQFFPLYGHETKTPFSFTNKYDELEFSPGHEKSFALWPIYIESITGIGSTNQISQRIILPFFSYQESELRRSITAPWPIGLTITRDDEKKYNEFGFPWPFFVIARGEGKNITRFWPLFGEASNPYKESDFYLWPLYKYNKLNTETADSERVRIGFFLYSDSISINKESGDASRRTSLWPLFHHNIDVDGKAKLISPALLEPIFPSNKPIERNYSPLWGLCREEKNPKDGKYSKSLLWNLLREDKTKEKQKCSALFGLIQVEKTQESTKIKLFHIPVSNKQTKSAKEKTLHKEQQFTTE
ncbi:MAG: hypothetical protein N2487_05740 [Verrucomicrobiae bacterium]|nr:hypothetical protein [Verrucomicrobiae bacterium]